MTPDQWVAGLVTGLVIGIPTGFGIALTIMPWLVEQWNTSIRLRRLLGRRDG